MDTGVIFYDKQVNGTRYEHIAHCICSRGNDFRYDGRSCADHKTDYYIPSVEQDFDKEKIAEENIISLLEVYGKEKIREVFDIDRR